MLYHYTCNKCIEKAAGKPVNTLPMDQYNQLAAQFVVEVEHAVSESPQVECPSCGDSAMRRIVSVQAGYIRGYGLADKSGAKNDMNLYQMTYGADPYKEHRKGRDSDDLVNMLRRNKEHNPKAKRVFVR